MLARRYWLLLPLALLFGVPAFAVTRVPLVINETFTDRAVPWPITTGVPFPRGALKSKEKCQLVDDRGRPQELQAKVAATWDAEKTSIRWLTIDFIAQPGRRYFLEFGDGIENKNGERWTLEAGERMWVGAPNGLNMGYLAEFNRATPSAFESVHIDLDKNGFVSPGERALHGGEGGEHYFIDQQGQRHSNTLDKISRQIVAEAEGDIHRTVRVEGYYTGPNGERFAKYRTRYHFFKKLPLLKVVDELQFIESTKRIKFRDIGFTMNLDLATKGRQTTFDQFGGPGNSPHTIQWKPETVAVASCQKTFRHYGNPESVGEILYEDRAITKVISTHEKVGEWVQVADDRFAVTAALRWFWQQFPKEWEVTRDALTMHYWSPRADELDFGKAGIEKFFGPAGEKYLRAGRENHNRNPLDHAFYHADLGAIERGDADGLGVNKHHEMWFVFTPAADAKLAQDYARHAADQPLCLASGEWNCSTDVFGPLAPRPNDSKYEAAVDKIFDLGRQGQDDFGDYGWWLFGAGPHYSYHTDEMTGKLYADSRRFEFHTYGKETQLWWNYLRSGERKFHDWAIPSENHWCDIAVSHQPTKIHCDWLGGTEQKNRTLHWRPGEWSIDNPTHYVRTHDRAEAWLRGGAQFWASYHRTLETTSLAHYITGDPRYNDVIIYWRDYWKDLAGKTNRSKNVQPWHQEQAWYQTFKDADKEMTWAEMIRDYAPFSSGSRHQHTLFFNLATLYEHTWDPQIKQVLDEYAAAFLDPQHAIGVWRSQDNSLPAHAEAPAMAHFWVPALWKYDRVTRDPRMKEIFAKYFDTAYAADPFREYEDVGVYSNTYCAYAYYFTRDPRYLTLAKHELDQLLPNSLPLKNPQEINQRLYNPYAPAKTFTAVPRLLWALQEGAKEGKVPDPPPWRMQRTLQAIYKSPDKELKATLWGFDPKIVVISPRGEEFVAKVTTKQYASDIQPFDRILRNFECYLHELTIPADSPAGNYLLVPRLELAVLQSNSVAPVLWNASVPVAIKPGETVAWHVMNTKLDEHILTSISLKALPKEVRVSLAPRTGAVLMHLDSDSRARLGWLRLDRSANQCWVSSWSAESPAPDVPGSADRSLTDVDLIARLLPPVSASEFGKDFVAGKFGQAAVVETGRKILIPDHVLKDKEKQKLFDEQQGTIEFWIRRRFDDRLSTAKPLPLLTNGLFTVTHQPTLPLGEWAHIALVWAPYHDQGTLTYVYVNGRDAANYRSLNWPGYSSPRPATGTKNAKWLEAFVAQAGPESSFEIDELRVSKIPRYADLAVKYGPQQTFNPVRFAPPQKAFEADEHTTLLLHFDGDLKSAVPGERVEAKFAEK